MMKRWHITLPDPYLAYLPRGDHQFDHYMKALDWAQKYAWANREEMMRKVLKDLDHALNGGKPLEKTAPVHCHHNYGTMENHFGENVIVVRKGATSAREGEMGIIPGSMGAKSYITRGKGNPDSFCSSSHGAGRRMGRKEAKRRFTVDDLKAQTEGVLCRKDADVIDEIPAAYKDVETVMAHQSDLVDIVATLKQVISIKGGGNPDKD
jgi:tRNA-splicing ligase RtcB